jgi:hypothetical protein
MHTIEKLRRYREHLIAFKHYQDTHKGITDPLSNYNTERPASTFGLESGPDALMATMVRERVLGKLKDKNETRT